MITLDATTKSLEIKLAGAVATTQCPFVCSYVDISQITFGLTGSGETDGTTNNTTAVTVAAGPAATTSRKINYLSVVNVDTAAIVLTVQLNNNGTARTCWKGTLAVGDSFTYLDGRGFQVLDANGQLKNGPNTVVLTTGVSGILPVANGGTALSSYAVGDIIIATGTGVIGRLAAVAVGQIVISQGINTAPIWSATIPSAVQDNITRLGTIVSGVWNAGAVTSSGTVAGVAGQFSGLLTVSGFGTHTFSASSNGSNLINLSNTNAGAAAVAGIVMDNDARANNLTLRSYGSGWASSGIDVPDSVLLRGNGAGGLSLIAQHASGAIRFYSGGTTLRAQINTNGTQTWTSYGAGAATFDASGNITSVSDERYKDRISPLSYGLSEILKLTPIIYGYNELSGLEREHLYGGFSAQEVQQIIPVAVGMDMNGYLTLADRPILGAVVNAIKQQESRIVELEALIRRYHVTSSKES